ncbi:unnamed protein product [Sphagnum tenellum]
MIVSIVVEPGSYEFGMQAFEDMVPIEEVAVFGADSIEGWLDAQKLNDLRNLAASEDRIDLFWGEASAKECFETHRKSDLNVTLLHGGKVIAEHKSKLYGW